MHTGRPAFLPVITLLGAAMLAAGCSTTSSPSPAYVTGASAVTAPKAVAPTDISVRVRIEEYAIENYSIISDTGPIKAFSVSGTPSSDGENMFFRLEPTLLDGSYADYYYLIDVPGKRRGEYTVTARKMTGVLNMQALAPPLYDFKLRIMVEKGVVRSAKIEEYGDRTVGMRLISSTKEDGRVIARIGSRIYTDTQWDCPMPRDDGEWRVSCTKI